MPWEPLQWVQKRAWSRRALEGQSRHREYRRGPGGAKPRLDTQPKPILTDRICHTETSYS